MWTIATIDGGPEVKMDEMTVFFNDWDEQMGHMLISVTSQFRTSGMLVFSVW